MKKRFDEKYFHHLYYCKYQKGLPLHLICILDLDRKNRRGEYTVGFLRTPDFNQGSLLFAYHPGLERYVKRLEKHGYQIRHIDSYDVAITQEEVEHILSMDYPPERLCALIGERIHRGKYFSFKRIEEGINRYLYGEINGSYLSYWAQLYSNAIKESISSRSKVSSGLFAASKAFEDLSVAAVARVLDDKERRKEVQQYIRIFADLDKIINPDSYAKLSSMDVELLDSLEDYQRRLSADHKTRLTI